MKRDYVELIKGGARIQLYRCAGRLFQERRSRASNPSPSGPLKNTELPDNAARDRMFDARLAELLADGWVDQRPEPAGARRQPDPAVLEDRFAALVARTIEALRDGDEANDAAVWRRAIRDYGALKLRAGGDRTEHLVHFFAVDGVALERKHPVVVKAVRAGKARKARWLALLEAARSPGQPPPRRRARRA